MRIGLLKNHVSWLILVTGLTFSPTSKHAIDHVSISFEPRRLTASERFHNGWLPTLTLPENIPTRNSPTRRDHEISNTYGKFPLGFEANQGQADPEVIFLSRGQGYSLLLTSTEAEFQFPIDDFQLSIESTKRNRHSAIEIRQSCSFRMKLVGANPKAAVEGIDKLPGISNYFKGNDPRKWLTNIPNYAKVRYHDIYPGIDLVYYGNPQQLEYDLVVSPNSERHNPSSSHLKVLRAFRLTRMVIFKLR